MGRADVADAPSCSVSLFASAALVGKSLVLARMLAARPASRRRARPI
jgi:hypothetical protein